MYVTRKTFSAISTFTYMTKRKRNLLVPFFPWRKPGIPLKVFNGYQYVKTIALACWGNNYEWTEKTYPPPSSVNVLNIIWTFLVSISVSVFFTAILSSVSINNVISKVIVPMILFGIDTWTIIFKSWVTYFKLYNSSAYIIMSMPFFVHILNYCVGWTKYSRRKFIMSRCKKLIHSEAFLAVSTHILLPMRVWVASMARLNHSNT